MQLTSAMVAAPMTEGPAEAWARAVEGLPRVLRGLVQRGRGNGARVTSHDVRVALSGPVGRDEPFAWSSRTAQRLVGLAALEHLLFGSARTPTDAVRDVVAGAVRRGSMASGAQVDRWLAALAPAGRAAVGAAAVTWSTRLWTALDWDALPTPLDIGRDHWWDGAGTQLALRSRVEVRCGTANLVVLTGPPRRASARHELSLVSLVEALRAGDGTRPAAVIGWWPDSGHLIRLESEPMVLDMGVAAVGAVLRSERREAA